MNRRRTITGLLLVLVAAGFTDAFIAPQEIPSILSLVYSNIPPVKKGTDSRVGFGYRLGEHADFQVLFELGPQKETKPIGNSASSSGDTSKRNVNQDDYLLAIAEKSPNPVGSSWLNSWSQDMRQQARRPSLQAMRQQASSQPMGATVAASIPIQTMPFIAESSLRQLQQLYGKVAAPVAVDAPITRPPVGTLPAASMDAVVQQLSNKVRYGNSVVPPPAPSKPATNAKITADLMDVDLS